MKRVRHKHFVGRILIWLSRKTDCRLSVACNQEGNGQGYCIHITIREAVATVSVIIAWASEYPRPYFAPSTLTSPTLTSFPPSPSTCFQDELSKK